MSLRELSLFTGAGGGLLGTKLLGWTHVGYVEWNEYCQRVIAARIADGYLDRAPIFTDVREFVQSGAAEQYRGIADVVSAGFPCQPFSVAGKQLADADERNMWPATVAIIRAVRPRSVLLENVPGLVSCGYVGAVLCDLAALGYVGGGGFSERPTLERPIAESDSGSWPTPRAQEAKHAAATDWELQTDHAGTRDSLRVQVVKRLWPTPNAADTGNRGGPSTPAIQRRKEIGKSIDLSMEVDGALNPDWVEWLMGWPIGWSALRPLGTARFQQWLHAHGGCSHESVR